MYQLTVKDKGDKGNLARNASNSQAHHNVKQISWLMPNLDHAQSK